MGQEVSRADPLRRILSMYLVPPIHRQPSTIATFDYLSNRFPGVIEYQDSDTSTSSSSTVYQCGSTHYADKPSSKYSSKTPACACQQVSWTFHTKTGRCRVAANERLNPLVGSWMSHGFSGSFSSRRRASSSPAALGLPVCPTGLGAQGDNGDMFAPAEVNTQYCMS